MNNGKRFEQDFKNSVPTDTYYLRLHDSSIGFDIENSTQRFALKSPYDCILFRNGIMYCLELKSTVGTSISFDGTTPMIKQHQVKELLKAATYMIQSGFIINFTKGYTYYLPVNKYLYLTETLNKKSFNEKDLKDIAVVIPKRKLKVNYRYDLSVLLG